MFPDYHIHSVFSADCETDVEKIIEKAKSIGMKSLCFTDHNDLDFPEIPDMVIFDLEIDKYMETLSELKRKHPDFDIRIGVEQGVMPSTIERLNNYSSEHPGLDFIICSTHVVLGTDPYYKTVFENYVEEKVYRTYFEDILNTVQKFHDYSVYGHIDYILRYGPTKAENFTMQKYGNLFEEIFKNIIEKGKGIEINTGSLYRELDFPHPHIDLLRLYKSLGGEIITIGSDSHDLDHIGYAFDKARELLLAEGFRYYTEFKKLKPEFKSLT